jgi:hypothetical protein
MPLETLAELRKRRNDAKQILKNPSAYSHSEVDAARSGLKILKSQIRNRTVLNLLTLGIRERRITKRFAQTRRRI